MKRLVLDAGPLIALVSERDNYHSEAKLGFSQISLLFGEVLTPLPILFEVYKFVSRNESPKIAQKLLSVIQKETVIVTISESDFVSISDLVLNFSHWGGTLEDASVIVIAKKYQGKIWTIDYKDLGFFGDIEFWNP
ncbi:type II toxin-antitoxin system VapC family toxin [Cyanobacterium aponinum]|uniref:PilT domain-containing protein n=1 Tax=Cyanobacterium aponinum (strain PCC 10605) TaxID=755178 RepID=K9Z497_CYAAP|nr:PIN domain-containing protein [Cyanobacterium aponinum]AFZ53964.1 PilT domain-containing protein [Cyanobacterium aponinum PCC 10605]PHV61843.1 PIN domain-containing protein [Cyanobacterium aponinum IPPAS B-1201]